MLSRRQHALCPLSGVLQTEITAPSVETPKLKGSSFKAWSRSEYSHECFSYMYWLGFLLWTNLHPPSTFTSIFFPKTFALVSLLAGVNTHSCAGLQNKTGLPAHCSRWVMQVPMLSALGIYLGSQICVVFPGWHNFKIVSMCFWLMERDWCVL